MSYDNCPEIREMYQNYRIVPLSWKYGMSADKASREILILGDDVKDLLKTDSVQPCLTPMTREP